MYAKKDVTTEFTYIRELLRQAQAILTSKSPDWEDADQLANELVASATVFRAWVEENAS